MINKAPLILKEVNEYDTLKKEERKSTIRFGKLQKRDSWLNCTDSYGGNKMSNTGLSRLLQRLAS